MAWFASSGLRVRLILLVLLALVPALGLVLYTAWEQRRQADTQVEATALQLVTIASTDHERLIEGARQLLITLSRLPEVRERRAHACSALFRDLLKQYRVYGNLGAVDLSGEVFCSGLPLPGGVNLADRGYVRDALVTRAFAVGEYQVGRITGKASINFGYPVIDETGQRHAVVFAALNLTWLNDLAARAGLPQGSTLTVVDRNGIVLARYPDPEPWVGRPAPEASIIRLVLTRGEGVAEAPGADGLPSLFGFTKLRGAPEAAAVYVNIGIPKRAAYAAANRVLGTTLAGLGIVAVLVLAATRVFGQRFILRPVEILVGTTRQVAAGDLGTRTHMPYEQGEWGHLARAFDEMAQALQIRDAQLEQQREVLYRTEKMAALGRLAAGVGHELRNPLTVIDGRIRLLAMDVSKGPLASQTLSVHLAKLQEAKERMRRIMESLSAYSKPSKPQPTLLDVGQLLAAAREVVAYDARRRDVEITVEVGETLPQILGDRSQLMQVLINLATNAIEAMPATGGQLTLRARAEGDGRDRPVRIDVSDTGPGIPPEALAKIWEAFYTTKPEGTGLGLSIVRGLIDEQPGATIEVESTPGHGTTFALTFPAGGSH